MKRALLAFGIYLTCVSVVQARGPCYLDEQVPYRIPIQGTIFIAFLKPQCFGVYKDGVLARYDHTQLFFGWTSTGARGMETPITLPANGPHPIARKVRMHFSKEVGVRVRGRLVRAAMPYAWFFDDRGRAVHEGNPREPRASHGCVRIPQWAAKALFERFRKDELRVIISPSMQDLLRRWN